MWMVTFADMMSLLMCFFVLLLSFAEMDVRRFMQIAGSMNTAFGAKTIPIQDEPINAGLKTGKDAKKLGTSKKQRDLKGLQALIRSESEEEADPEQDLEYPELVMELQRARRFLEREINEGKVDIQGGKNMIMLRIQEKSAFPSGSSDVIPDFGPLLARVADLLATTRGTVTIAGHTDDRPISTSRYRSNWELSTARAVTVVHGLLANEDIDPARVEVRGYGHSMPLVPNEDDDGRSINRRVEIILTQEAPKSSEAASQDVEESDEEPEQPADAAAPGVATGPQPESN